MHGRTGTTAAPPAPTRERSRLSKAFFRCCARAESSILATLPLELEACRAQSGDRWDKDEIYFVYDELKKAFPAMTFDRLSPCSGILSLWK